MTRAFLEEQRDDGGVPLRRRHHENRGFVPVAGLQVSALQQKNLECFHAPGHGRRQQRSGPVLHARVYLGAAPQQRPHAFGVAGSRGSDQVEITFACHGIAREKLRAGQTLDLARADRLGFLLQVFVENRKNVTFPENVDQSGLGDASFDFDNHFGWDLDQRAGRIAQAASRMLGELHCLQGLGNLIAHGRFGASHRR
jgi:hypothetical protein